MSRGERPQVRVDCPSWSDAQLRHFRELRERIKKVPGSPLVEFEWLSGALGEPSSPVFFIAENPSMRQLRLAERRASLATKRSALAINGTRVPLT